MINGKKHELVENYKLKQGENIIQLIIESELIDLQNMFLNCNTLKNIDELKYLDTKEITNCSYMFCRCYIFIKKLECF